MTPYTHHEISKIHQAECRADRDAIRQAKLARKAEIGKTDGSTMQPTSHLSLVGTVQAGLSGWARALTGGRVLRARPRNI
jgi:hypothetical protein